MKRFMAFFTLLCTATLTHAAPPPYEYGSLRKSEANVRRGPGTQYPIVWIYKRYGWPVEVLAEYQSWYKIRDVEGEEGWIYRSLLSKRRTVIVDDGGPVTMFKEADGRKPLYKFAPGVILELSSCGEFQCEVSYNKQSGWVMKDRLLMVGEGK